MVHHLVERPYMPEPFTIEHQITDIEKLKEFDVAGYQYSSELSKGNDWVFTLKEVD
ncbi:MAG: cytoplasmic iron level regulating protein YaaA (DUF328/UPF0246 family) [Psychroserpens sp.]|jgi:cytoplasmic iron level regulating protein YaaA (DUF328/UPF0246 family)